ncbi:MAG: hypothetical protein AAFU85_29575 [Planctomycetota bacterium]
MSGCFSSSPIAPRKLMSIASSPPIDATNPDPGSDFGDSASSFQGLALHPKASPNRTTADQRPRSARRKCCVGIDIGSSEVRVACLEFAAGEPVPTRWRTSHRFPIPEGVLSPERLASLPGVIASALPRCVDGESNTTAISLPIDWTHYQIVAGNELGGSARRCDEMFAASAFQSVSHHCHWPVVGVHHGRPSLEDQYVIAAVSKQLVCEIATEIARVGYHVASAIPHGVVLSHAAPALTGILPQLVVWLGREAALVAVRHQSGVGLVRVLPSVPESILEAECEDRPLDRFALRPYLADVANELSATMRYAARVDMNQPSDRPILVCGPLAEIAGTEETIAKVAATPVAIWKYAAPIRPTPTSRASHLPMETQQRADARFATALSLCFAANRCSKRGYAK